MPRILRIINRLNLGGPTFNAALLTKHLSPQFDTMLVAGMKEETEASSEFILNKLGLSPTYIPNMYRSLNPFKDLPAYKHIKKIIQDYKPDIVHTHAAKAGALGRLAAYECGVPVVVHTFHGHVFHSYFGPLKTRFYIEVERMLGRMSNRIVAISNEQKRELGETYNICNKDKIATIPLGFDLDKFQQDQINKRIDFRSQYQIADDEVAIGIVGRLVSVKNHELFLQSLKQVLNNSTQKVRAFIVGDGEERSHIEQIARNLNINFATAENATSQKAPLTFTSWITDIDQVYAGIDIVALSSLNEGTPVSLIEAQAANRPIVSTNVGGVSDVVIENQTALLSPSQNVEQFAANLMRLAEDKNLRNRMGENGYDFVQQRFSYQRLVNDMSKLYHDLLWEASPAYRETWKPQAQTQVQLRPNVAPARTQTIINTAPQILPNVAAAYSTSKLYK